jgi:hypothetical protein
MRSSLISALVAGSLLVSSTASAARPPEAFAARTGTEIGESEEIAGTFMIVGIIVVLLIIGGFIIFDDDDEPDSP